MWRGLWAGVPTYEIIAFSRILSSISKLLTFLCNRPLFYALVHVHSQSVGPPFFHSFSCSFIHLSVHQVNRFSVHLLQEFHEKDLSNLSTHCYDANIVVRPTRGTAIMWYNHVVDNVTGLLGAQDERSLHGGCDVLEGHKWIANNWINAPFKWTD